MCSSWAGSGRKRTALQHMHRIQNTVLCPANRDRGVGRLSFVEPGQSPKTTPCSAGIQNDHLAGGDRHSGSKWRLSETPRSADSFVHVFQAGWFDVLTGRDLLYAGNSAQKPRLLQRPGPCTIFASSVSNNTAVLDCAVIIRITKSRQAAESHAGRRERPV